MYIKVLNKHICFTAEKFFCLFIGYHVTRNIHWKNISFLSHTRDSDLLLDPTKVSNRLTVNHYLSKSHQHLSKSDLQITTTDKRAVRGIILPDILSTF